jgi:DNA-binding NarL/FixJ family response regulator
MREAQPLARGRADDTPLDALSPRQREVFLLLASGLSNKMIARKLGITEGTVKSHVATIFDVLQVHNRVSAVAEARRLSGEPNQIA